MLLVRSKNDDVKERLYYEHTSRLFALLKIRDCLYTIYLYILCSCCLYALLYFIFDRIWL